MTRLLIGVILVGFSAVQAGAEEPKKCDLYNCPCQYGPTSKLKYCESEKFFKTLNDPDSGRSFCWHTLAQYHVTDRSLKTKDAVMDRAFAEAARGRKPLLFVGNTGG